MVLTEWNNWDWMKEAVDAWWSLEPLQEMAKGAVGLQGAATDIQQWSQLAYLLSLTRLPL